MPQNIVMGQIPGQMQTPKGQPRMPNQQQFYHGQRPMRIPRHQNPNNPPMYGSPPGPPMTVQMIGPGPPPFIPPGQNPQFIPQHVSVNWLNVIYMYKWRHKFLMLCNLYGQTIPMWISYK